MIQSRRTSLNELTVQRTCHAGLWLDKFITSLDREDTQSRRSLIEQVAGIPIAEAYDTFFMRWRAALKSSNAIARVATVQGRMVVGLGDESVLETSVSLHHTYGVPYIPGSALKGLAASYARQRLDQEQWGATSQAYRVLFGDTANAGYLTFYDALYVPGSGHQGRALYPDVMTVHHPEYYQGGGQPPADWDNPTPIPFLSATGQYLVALAGPTPAWVERTFGILQRALGEMGIGAKTSSGYGRLRLEGSATEATKTAQAVVTPVATAITPEQAQVNAMIHQVQQLRSNMVAGQIAQHVERWRKLEAPPSLKRQLAEAILKKVQEAGRTKADSEKAWYQALMTYITENA